MAEKGAVEAGRRRAVRSCTRESAAEAASGRARRPVTVPLASQPSDVSVDAASTSSEVVWRAPSYRATSQRARRRNVSSTSDADDREQHKAADRHPPQDPVDGVIAVIVEHRRDHEQRHVGEDQPGPELTSELHGLSLLDNPRGRQLWSAAPARRPANWCYPLTDTPQPLRIDVMHLHLDRKVGYDARADPIDRARCGDPAAAVGTDAPARRR